MPDPLFVDPSVHTHVMTDLSVVLIRNLRFDFRCRQMLYYQVPISSDLCRLAQFMWPSSAPVYSVVSPLFMSTFYFIISAHNMIFFF